MPEKVRETMYKRSLICTIIWLLVLLLLPISVQAEDKKELSIETEIGFEGKANPLEGFPIKVVVHNHSEREISGDIAITVSPAYSMDAGDVVQWVDLQPGSSQTVTLSIPSYSVESSGDSTPRTIRFYESGWEHGEELDFNGTPYIGANGLGDENYVIGVLSDHSDTLSSLKDVTYQSPYSAETIQIKADNIPEEGVGLNMLSMIFAHDVDMSSLSTKQQSMIEAWVYQGGTLVLTNPPSDDDWAETINQMLPITTSSSEDVVSSEFLTELTENSFPEETISLWQGDVANDADVMFHTSNGQPILVASKAGKGEYAQLTVSPELFSDWEYAPDVWRELLQPFMVGHSSYEDFNELENYMHSISYVSNLFPSSFISLTLLVFIYMGYILVICPVIYLVLKRIDKREHAWWILPSVSVLLSIAIFFIGGKDRIHDQQVNENVLLQLNEQGKGFGVASTSFLNSQSGTYQLGFQEDMYSPFPISESTYFGSTQQKRAKVSVRYDQQGEQVITYEDRDFWSVSNAAGPINGVDVGKIESDLTFTDGEIKGTIANHTNVTIESLYFLAGTEVIDLGRFEKEQERNISFPMVGKVLFSPTNNFYSYEEQSSLEETVENELFNAAFTLELFENGYPAIVALTHDSIVSPTINGETGKHHARSLLVKSAMVHSEQVGSFTLSNKDLSVHGLSYSGDIYFEEAVNGGETNIYVENGTYEVEYSLPSDLMRRSNHFNTIRITDLMNPDVMYSIYNVDSQSFEEINGDFPTDQPGQFINGKGVIRVQIQKSGLSETVGVPQITLEGELVDD